MQNQEITRQIQQLQSLFSSTAIACGGDIEMQAHWARYLCILCAGFLENSLKEVYATFVSNAASPPVARFTISTLNKVQNPKTTKFIDTARSFKSQWGDDLEIFVNQDGRREAINSIMNNRHQIAHGKVVDITIARIKDYFGKSIQVIEFIEDQCDSS